MYIIKIFRAKGLLYLAVRAGNKQKMPPKHEKRRQTHIAKTGLPPSIDTLNDKIKAVNIAHIESKTTYERQTSVKII